MDALFPVQMAISVAAMTLITALAYVAAEVLPKGVVLMFLYMAYGGKAIASWCINRANR